MPHFFVPPQDISAGKVIIRGEEYHHLIDVCRNKVGDEINVFDGTGRIYLVRIEKISSRQAVAKIIQQTETEKKVQINLFSAIPKGERFSWLIEKVSELGVANVYPVIFERSSFCPDENWAVSRLSRWQKLALAATKQSGQSRIARVHLPKNLEVIKSEWKSFYSPDNSGLSIVAWEKEESRKIVDLEIDKPVINIFIGPEGGITEREMDLLRSMGVIPVTLGKYILRIETAAVVCVGIFNYFIK